MRSVNHHNTIVSVLGANQDRVVAVIGDLRLGMPAPSLFARHAHASHGEAYPLQPCPSTPKKPLKAKIAGRALAASSCEATKASRNSCTWRTLGSQCLAHQVIGTCRASERSR